MKYLFIIAAIVVLTTIISFFALLPKDKTPEHDIALTINGHSITDKTIAQEHKKFGYHTVAQTDLFDAIITRELLIQEAQRQGIDKEPDFKKALKDYYETSLIKVLYERKNRQLVVNVDESEINHYISYLNKTVTFTRLDKIPENASAAATATGVSDTSLFDDLADSVKVLLSSLSPGQFGVMFDTGNEKYALRLDKVQDLHNTNPYKPKKKHIIAALKEFKREQMINAWLTGLKNNATVTIHKKK